jgi:hypothetical protein
MSGDTHRNDEKERKEAMKNDLSSCYDRCVVDLRPAFPPHKHGVIAYAGNLVAIKSVSTSFNIPMLLR